ncbi:MAG: MFS transporter [Bacteroidetes bacterium]|nr:MAG: MFS transporter [Bacteroidota bacterium]
MAANQPMHADSSKVKKPSLSLGSVINLSMGFLGIQMGFGLQNGNASRILTDFGADVHELSMFWLVAPFTGLIVQPIIGHMGDNTWGKLGRRKPYFLVGAILAALGLIFLPNSDVLAGESLKATEFLGLSAILWMGVIFLALMDASFNISMEPFRALVGDMLPKRQGTLGFSVQTILISVGAILGSLLPKILNTVFGISNEPIAGSVAPNVVWSFYVGAIILIATILYTIVTIKEYPPEDFAKFQGTTEKKEKTNMFADIFRDTLKMPLRMRRLALVQFFSWFGLFTMWVYTTNSIAQNVYDVELGAADYMDLKERLLEVDTSSFDKDKLKSYHKAVEGLVNLSPSSEDRYFINSSISSFVSQGILMDESKIWEEVVQLKDSKPELFKGILEERYELVQNSIDKGDDIVVGSALSSAVMEHGSIEGLELISKLKSLAKEHQTAGDQTGVMFGIYNFIALIFAFLLNPLAKATSRKFVHFASLMLGGVGLISLLFVHNADYLWVSMIGVGIAWASILAMPYALLIDSLPANKMGVYMGIFNFFIVIPQIINGFIGGPIIHSFFNDYSINYLMFGGVFMVLAALFTLRIREPLFSHPNEPLVE